MAIRARDDRTADLFQVPASCSAPAAQDYRTEVSTLVSDCLTGASSDRHAVADRISDLVGRPISKPMLDGYASPARDTFNMPLAIVPAFELATRSHALTEWLAGTRGGRVLYGRDALAGDLARLERQRFEATRRIRSLRKLLGAGK